MRIAISTWNDCVSSVFDFSSYILLLEIENGIEVSRSMIALDRESLFLRAGQLRKLKVDVLICGAISRRLADMIAVPGIHLLAYITGNISDVLSAYQAGKLSQSRFVMPGCWLGARKGFAGCDQGRHRCGAKGDQIKTSGKENKGNIMKIVITAQGKDPSSEIDLRFGRAKWLILFDTETDSFQAHDNELNLNAAQGAGIQTGRNIANLGADAVITGNIGPNAFKTLTAAKVKIFLAEKQTVKEAIELCKAGQLKEVDQANVEGHWV